METRACFKNIESTLSVIRSLDLGAQICSPLTTLTDLSISVMKIYEKIVSSICQRLLDKHWKPYELEMIPQIEGIYLIGRTDPRQDPEVLYVGRTNYVHRRMEEHKRQDLDRYVNLHNKDKCLTEIELCRHKSFCCWIFLGMCSFKRK